MKKIISVIVWALAICLFISAGAEDMPVISWETPEPTPTTEADSRTSRWLVFDWSNNSDGLYFVVLTSDDVDEDSAQAFIQWLYDTYAIPAITYRVDPEDAAQHLSRLMEGNANLAGILLFGYDGDSLSDTREECVEHGLFAWVSERTQLDQMKMEIGGLLDSLFALVSPEERGRPEGSER